MAGLAVGDVVNDLTSWVGDPNVSIHEGRRSSATWRRNSGRRSPILGETRAVLAQARGVTTEPMGFFTDTTVCIGCKACEVACKVEPAAGAEMAAHTSR